MKKITQKTDTRKYDKTQPQYDDIRAHYFDNLARITSSLLSAILALLTFLLLVGVQNSIDGFSTSLYVTITMLGTSLILYAASYMIREFYYASLAKSSNQKNSGQKKNNILVAKLLKGVQILQQLVFIGSIGTILWFTISYAQLFLNPKPVAPPTTQQNSSQQSTPSPSDTAGPAPGETPEQHAQESQATQP